VTVTGSRDLFGRFGQAADYAKFRPTYPAPLYKALLKQLGTRPGSYGRRHFALDLACGSGQVTVPLAKWFDSVVGIDQSQEQLRNASRPRPEADVGDVDYQAWSAYELTELVAPQSVDLVTVAQALHWMDTDAVISQVSQVLRPGGVFAVMGYGRPILADPRQEAAYRRFYYDVLGSGLKPGDKGCYWDIDRSTVDGAFPEIADFGPDFMSVAQDMAAGSFRREWFKNPQVSQQRDFFGYLRSGSAYQTYLQRTGKDPLPELYADMGVESVEDEVEFTFPFFLLTARRR